MAMADVDFKGVCEYLLHAESEDEVTTLLTKYGLLETRHWKPLGNIPNNRSLVNNQQQDPAGAKVEKIINALDAMLTKECFLHSVAPDSPNAPPTMTAAAEKFFRIRDGNLANLTAAELTRLAENIQVVATGSKQEPCYLIIDKGEGQTPARFEDTFLSLVKANKARIPFVQGKFNVGGTGVLPFCGRQAYELIISRRCPELPSDPSVPGSRDSTHGLWGFTLVRKIPPSAGLFDTMVYVYLAPDGRVPSFESQEILALPDISKVAEIGEFEDEDTEGTEEVVPSKDGTPRPYRLGLPFGTVIKLYNYRWKARSLATRDVRFELERWLYRLSLPVRVIETRSGYRAHYFATTVAGTSVTISKDRENGFLEDSFPAGGEILPDGLGTLPISITLYRERKQGERKAKALKRLPKGLFFTINGQVHYSIGPEFFVTRGLNYEYIKDTMLVTVDCTGLPEDIRDQIIMPSRDRLRRIPEFETILDSIVADLKDREVLRSINDERRLRRTKEALTQDAVQDVFQSLINKDPVFASLLQNGKGLRNPFDPGREPRQPFKGKLPPTYFQFENGKNEIQKSFSLDRTCAVELQTDAINGYFELPSPVDRGSLTIEPKCYERWNLWNGRLRVVFRAPSNARIGDSMNAIITVTDPNRKIRGDAPWANSVALTFVEGGKEVKSGSKQKRHRESAAIGLPEVVLVRKDQWDEHGFHERSALRISRKDNGGFIFFVNIENTYLVNELMRRPDPEKEAAKFAFQWGLVLVALGMLQGLKKEEAKPENVDSEDEDTAAQASLEEQVGRFSSGVAAVIVPTVLNLMDSMKGLPQPVSSS